MAKAQEKTNTIEAVVDTAIDQYNDSPASVVFARVAGQLTVREMLAAEQALSARLNGADVTIGQTGSNLKILMDTRDSIK